MPRQYTPRVLRTCEQCGSTFAIPPNRVKAGRGRFCSPSCRMAYCPPLDRLLWDRVDRSDPDACWLWPGDTRVGYGVICRATRRHSTHRLAWELTNGPIPDGLVVCHSCDVRYPISDTTYRRCINPAHLWLGTSAENTADRHRKGRDATGNRNGSHLHPERIARGERQGAARLSEADVLRIRDMYAQAGLSQTAIASRFGVHKGTVSHIVRRKNWRHI